MVSITCACIECKYNGSRHKCTAKNINLSHRNMITVNEGRVDMWVCNKYELAEEINSLEESFKKYLEILNTCD